MSCLWTLNCGKACKAHDFGEFTWRHLNFFQHHCYITAKVPRTDAGPVQSETAEAAGMGRGCRFVIRLTGLGTGASETDKTLGPAVIGRVSV